MNKKSFKMNEPFCWFSWMVVLKTSITEDDSHTNLNFIILSFDFKDRW